MNQPTPTRHGNWIIRDGELVDLDQQPLVAHTDARIGGPGIPVPLADQPNPDITPDDAANPDAGEPASGKAGRRRKTTTHTTED